MLRTAALGFAISCSTACPSGEVSVAGGAQTTAATAASGEAQAATGAGVATPPAGAGIVSWWCACSSADPDDSKTFCFVEQASCTKLKADAGAEFTDAHCVDVGKATHPSGRLSGAGWVSIGAGGFENPDCGLEEVPLETPAQVLALEQEEFGGLALGQDSTSVLAKLGKPSNKGPIEAEAATGDVLQDWAYLDKGLQITFSVTGTRLSVSSLQLTAPGLSTHRGVQVGDDYAEALGKYAQVVSAPYHFEADDRFVVGSLYFGLAVDSTQGKVSSIFWGGMAE